MQIHFTFSKQEIENNLTGCPRMLQKLENLEKLESVFFQKHAGKTGKYILFNLCMLEKLEIFFFKYQILLFNKLGHFDVVILSFVESNGQIWYNCLFFSNILLLCLTF